MAVARSLRPQQDDPERSNPAGDGAAPGAMPQSPDGADDGGMPQLQSPDGAPDGDDDGGMPQPQSPDGADDGAVAPDYII